jgi:hypothetical protein
MPEEEIDEYSLLYLQFVFFYCFDVVLANNTLIYHIFDDNAHETCVDAEASHQVQYFAWQHVHLFASRRRRMAISTNVSMLEQILLTYFTQTKITHTSLSPPNHLSLYSRLRS